MAVTTVVATALLDRPYCVVPHGLEITRALSFDEWRACGVALTTIANRTNWAIGDWLVYGAGRGDFGAYYGEAAAITGRSFESLSQYARVSQTFPIAQRDVPVPWSFYREALRAPVQDRVRALELAARNGWTKDGLAEYISTRDGAAPPRAKAIADGSAHHRTAGGWHTHKSHHRLMQCPSCGFKFEPKRRHRLTMVKG